MTNHSQRLAGKVALISGTGGGQGRVAALRFAQEGAHVVGCDVNAEAARETERLVTEAGFTMTSAAPLDVASPEGAREWIELAVEKHGVTDILYNNASTPRFAPFADMSAEDFHFTIRNELEVMWFPTQAAWPYLIAQGGGAVLNVASLAGISGIRTLPQAAHAASKGAIIGVTPQLAAEGAPHGIRVNCISPGVIASPPTLELLSLGDEGPLANLVKSIASGKLGEPEDIVNAAVYLVSDEASWVTASHFVIDGGATRII